MRRRLLLFFLPSIYAPASVANEALWNCEQNTDSKEWVCTGEKKPVEKSSAVKTPITTAPVETIRSTVTQPGNLGAEKIVKPDQPVVEIHEKPVVEEPAAVTKPVESPQPVLAKPESIKPQQESVGTAIEQKDMPSPAKTKVDKADRQISNVANQNVKPPVDADSKNTLQTENNRPGWSCDAKATDQTWDCKLAGTDPKGQTRVIETTGAGLNLLTPAFDYNQEQTFGNLRAQLKHDPWQNCFASRGTAKQFVSDPNARDEMPLDINSNYAEVFENEIYSYTGNVEMLHGGQRSVSKKASYDKVSGALDLQGSVYYSDEELALHSESASINLTSDQAKLRDALFIYPATPIRGSAKTIYRDSSTLSRYRDVAYTSCRPGNQDWVLHASELKLNKTTGQGSARNTWLEFKGAPVFYSPLLAFPTDNRRLSGFLAPNFGNTTRSGFTLAVPYYWNIAPNYDATIRPRYLSSRGAILGVNFRYLTEMSNGITNLEYMPHDSLLNKARYLAAIKNTTQFTPNISSNLDLNYASDKTYFSDLGNALSTSTYSSFLKSQASLAYVNTGVSLKGYADSYESIDPAITPAGIPYRRLPQVNLNLNHSFDFMPLNTLLDAEYVYFQQDTLDNAQRTNVKPSVSFPMKTAGSFLTPKLSLQSTQYLLSNPQGVQSASLSRTLPIFSTDSGLYLEKDVNFSDRSYLHTLEPRLFYLYIPRVDQSNIPILDTGLIDSSFNSLFLENRFSGSDRVQDANQLTAAITTRLVDAQSGKERLKLSVGQIAYFQDREVTLNSNLPNFLKYNYPVETNKFSNLVTELNAGLTDHISLMTGTQWDPHLNEIVRHTSGLHYLNKPDANLPGEIFNLGYRYRKNTLIPVPAALAGTRPYDIIQSDVSFHWPVYNEWSVVGRWTYSLLNDRTQESFLGVEKENCCWAFRLIGRRWVNSVLVNSLAPAANTVVNNATGVAQSGIFFEIELKGLSAFGEKLDTFFEKQIYGYRKTEK
jgi:LPS-assembly protein